MNEIICQFLVNFLLIKVGYKIGKPQFSIKKIIQEMEQTFIHPVFESNTKEFFEMARSSFKFPLYLFLKLPSAFFSGLRIKSMDEEVCVVTIPYKWFSQNPFKSTYFACLSMAAEMSTGALGLAHTHKSNPSVSMLVVSIEGDFYKKATGLSSFVCREGLRIKETIADAIYSGEGKSIQVTSVGTNENGEKVAEFRVTWSFKARK